MLDFSKPKETHISLIADPTFEQMTAAIEKTGYNIQFIYEPPEDICYRAMNRGYCFRYIRNPSTEMTNKALSLNWYNLKFVKNPTPEQEDIAIENSGGLAIQFIERPTFAQKMVAITKTPSSIQYIKNLSENMIYLAVSLSSHCIKFIKNPSEKLQLQVVNDNPLYIEFIDNPTPEIIDLAFELSKGETIKWIDNPTIAQQWFCVRNSPSNFHYVKNPCESIKRYILRRHPVYIHRIEHPSRELCLIAARACVAKGLKEDTPLWKFIDKFSIDVILTYPSATGLPHVEFVHDADRIQYELSL